MVKKKGKRKTKKEIYQDKFNKKANNFLKPIFSIPGFILLGLIAYLLDKDGFLDNIFDVGKGFGYIILLMIIGIIGAYYSDLIYKGKQKEEEDLEERRRNLRNIK